MPKYEICYPSSDVTYAAVARVEDGAVLTFKAYSDGTATDLFDVRLYGDPEGDEQEQRWYAQSTEALQKLLDEANRTLDAAA